MKYLTLYLFLLSALLLIYTIGCRVQRDTPETYTGRQLIFGNGGGFTGATAAYILLDNGQLFSVHPGTRTHTETYTALKKVPRTITRQLFAKADDLQLDKAEFSYPGNIYYFIGLKTNNATHRITWGHPGHQAPTEAENLYHQLQASLPQ
jgi:hypothetical protein